jgi:hypothetical protein
MNQETAESTPVAAVVRAVKRFFPRNAPQITTGGSLQPRGSKECACGRTISANKTQCKGCADVRSV